VFPAADLLWKYVENIYVGTQMQVFMDYTVVWYDWDDSEISYDK
jgi:hypothetical protein